MVLSMARPQKHRKTGVYQFRKAVPRDLRPLLGKTEEVRSLRTKDIAEARRRHAEVALEIEAKWRSLLGGTQRLTAEQVEALAGQAYRDTVAQFGSDPGNPEGWEGSQSGLEEALEAFEDDPGTGRPKLERAVGDDVGALLASHGLRVDDDTRTRLLERVAYSLHRAYRALQRRAWNDYRPDPQDENYPAWRAPEARRPAPPENSGVSLIGMVEDWWEENQRAGTKLSTFEGYRNTMRIFVAFLKHDDARRVTPEDVIGFKDHRLKSVNPRNGKLISPKTVKTADLVALKSVFKWGVDNRKVDANPALGVTLKLRKRVLTRSPGFTDDEARALLRAADARTRGGDEAKTFAAKRWVPWLCAYTGARVGELAQLRRQDVRQEGDHWVIRITPDAGTVKTNEARDVVLHPHLVEKGFPEFVQGSATGHLFLTIGKAGDVRGPLRGLRNRLAETGREIVKDEGVQPNHGWRHRFKAVALSVGMDSRLADAIQGHAPSTEGGRYGDNTPAAQALALAKFPRQGGT